MNSCDSYQELISRLVDGELSPEEHKALMAHLKTCSRCNAMFAVFHDLSDILSDEPEELPEGLHENIMAGVRRSAIIKKNRRMRAFGLRLAVSAAACAVLVLFAAGVFGPGGLKDSTSLRSAEEAAQLQPPAAPEITLPPAETNEPRAETVPDAGAVPAPASQPETAAPAWPAYTAPTPIPAPAYADPDPYGTEQYAGQTDTSWNADFPAQPEITIDPSYFVSNPAPAPVQVPEAPAEAVTGNAAPFFAAEEAPAENTLPAEFFQAPAAYDDAAPEIAANFSVYAAGDSAVFNAAAEEDGEAAEEADSAAAESAEESAAAEEPVLVANGMPKRPAPDKAAEDSTPEEEMPETADSAVEKAGTTIKESWYSVRGTQKRMELLLRLGGGHGDLPNMKPTRLIHVELLPDEDYGSTEKLEIRIYVDFIFFTHISANGESSSFRADCSVRELDAWLDALPAPADTPAPTADPFSDESAGE